MPRDGSEPPSSRLLQGPQRIRRLAGLREGHDQGVRTSERLPVPELARLLHAALHPGQRLEPVAGHEPRVVGGAAGDDLHGADPVEHRGGARTERRLQHPAFVATAGEGRRHGLRLLVNLLRHEVPPLPAIDHRGAQGVREHGTADRPAGSIHHPHRLRGHVDDVPVLEDHVLPGNPDEGRDVGGDEVLAGPDPDDEGASPDRRDEAMRVVRGHHPEGVGPFEDQDRVPDGFEKVEAAREIVVDPVSDHLRVGLGVEPVPRLQEIGPDVRMVLDDPVVDDRDLLAAHEGVRVRLGRLPVRRPASVGDPGAPVRPVPCDERLELGHLPHRPHPVDAVPHHRESRRIVAAVLDPPQTFEEEGHHVAPRDRPDDSTHDSVPLRSG